MSKESLEFPELKKYTKCKKNSIKADLKSKYAFMLNADKAMRADSCSSYLLFEKFQNIANPDEFKRILCGGEFCNLRFCENCQMRRTRKLSYELSNVLQQIKDKGDYQFLFLTLTIKNCSLNELKSSVQRMSKAFNLMTKYDKFIKAIKGYFRSIEFVGDKTPPNMAHPHFHCILIVNKSYFSSRDYINHDEWVEMWQKALKCDYKPVVNIKKIKPKIKNDVVIKDVFAVALEVAKYEVKGTHIAKMSNEAFEIFDRETRGIRHYNKGGLFKDLKPLRDKNFENEWESIVKEYFAFNGRFYEFKAQY